MITSYLNFTGKAREALHYYAEAFEAPAPLIMSFGDMPADHTEGLPADTLDQVIYGTVATYAEEIRASDDMPGNTHSPTASFFISVTHDDEQQIRRTFAFLAKDGQVVFPLEPAFFSPLYGQVEDKYGYRWLFMLPSHMAYGG